LKIEKKQNDAIRIELTTGLLKDYIFTQTSETFQKDYTSYGCDGKNCSNPFFMKGTTTFHSTVEGGFTVEKLPPTEAK